MPNPLSRPDGPTETRTVRGTKLVVISAGALGTPGILERSGIGGKEVLEGVGVKQRVDLPGVGENYQGAPIIGDERTLLIAFGHVQITPICSLRTLPQMTQRLSMRCTLGMQTQSQVCSPSQGS